MAKFKFGTPPKTFSKNIKFKTLNGVDENFDVTFHYRTRKEFGALFDEMLAAAKARTADTSKDDMTMSEIMDATAGENAQYLLKALSGWELEQDLDMGNAERLCNEYPAAAAAVMEAYKAACLEGRLGN